MGPCRDTPTVPGWWGLPFPDPMGGATPMCPPQNCCSPGTPLPGFPWLSLLTPPKLEHFNK